MIENRLQEIARVREEEHEGVISRGQEVPERTRTRVVPDREEGELAENDKQYGSVYLEKNQLSEDPRCESGKIWRRTHTIPQSR